MVDFPDFEEEKAIWQKGIEYVVGLDEVGRGAFAGPLVVGAVIFKPDTRIEGVNDSKLLKPLERVKMAKEIKRQALAWEVSEVPVSVINKVGIGKATHIAFRKVLANLSVKPQFVLIDAFYVKHFKKDIQKPIIKGDRKSISIAAASIIAKVHRDRIMKKLHKNYPLYGFARHKGYGTKKHQEAIRLNGLCKLHRTSFNLEQFTLPM